MKGLTVLLLTCSMIFLPVISLPAYSPRDICAQAKSDALNDSSRFLWLGAGCLLSFIGVLIGYVISPTPPAERLIGKDANYMMQYISCYGDAGKSVQGVNAAIGCLAMFVTSGLIMWITLANE